MKQALFKNLRNIIWLALTAYLLLIYTTVAVDPQDFILFGEPRHIVLYSEIGVLILITAWAGYSLYKGLKKIKEARHD